jgi:hypothetical protein
MVRTTCKTTASRSAFTPCSAPRSLPCYFFVEHGAEEHPLPLSQISFPDHTTPHHTTPHHTTPHHTRPHHTTPHHTTPHHTTPHHTTPHHTTLDVWEPEYHRPCSPCTGRRRRACRLLPGLLLLPFLLPSLLPSLLHSLLPSLLPSLLVLVVLFFMISSSISPSAP